MFNILKLIIIFFICSHLYNSNKNSDLNSVKQNNVNQVKHNDKNCKHSYEYSKIEKLPTQEEDGIKMYLCKFCRKKYFETIPRLNKKIYNLENLVSNCENGNGIRYMAFMI